MADRAALGLIGYIFGGVTAAVMLLGVVVVSQSTIADPQLTQAMTLSSKAR